MSTAENIVSYIEPLPPALVDNEASYRTDSYFMRVPRFGADAVLEAIHADYQHVLAEFMCGQIRTHFTAHIDAEKVSSGGYHDPVKAMAGHFIASLAERQGKKLDRSTVEGQVWLSENLQFVPWAAEDPTSRYWIWSSPPGAAEDGYHGSAYRRTGDPRTPETNHTFLYLKWVEPQLDGSLIVHAEQLRGWPSMEQLITLQNSLQPNTDNTLTLTDPRLDLRAIERVIPIERPDSKPEVVMQEILEKLYATQHTRSWGTNPSQLPKFDRSAFFEQAGRVWQEFLRPQMEKLLQQVPTTQSAVEAFWHTKNYHDLLACADLVHEYAIRSLLKWVIDQNTNPKFKPAGSIALLKAQIQQLVKFQPQQISVQKLTQTFALHAQHKIEPETLSSSQRRWLSLALPNQLALNTGSLASLTQCIALSPMSMLSPSNGLAAAGAGSISSTALTTQLFTEKQYGQAQEYAKNHGCRLVELAGQTWMVPENYFDNNGKCYEKNGVVYGPCDVPLAEDPLCQRIALQSDSPERFMPQKQGFFDPAEATADAQSGLSGMGVLTTTTLSRFVAELV